MKDTHYFVVRSATERRRVRTLALAVDVAIEISKKEDATITLFKRGRSTFVSTYHADTDEGGQ